MEFVFDGYRFVIDDSGFRIVCRIGHDGSGYYEDIERKRKIGRILIGDDSFFMHCKDEYIWKILRCLDGLGLDEANEFVENLVREREDKKREEILEREKYQKIREKFSGYVIGIDKEIDVFQTGFSVRVLFKSDESFENRKRFVKENTKEFVKYVIGELEDSKKVTNRIGDMKFYKPVSIVTLRSAEVEVKFEVKRDIA